MNFLQLVLKQMRQRALSTWLTLVSVLLGVALAIAIMVFQREGRKLFGQSDFGYDLIVGPKGSPVQLVLNSVYHLDKSPGNIAWSVYQDVAKPRHPFVRSALPVAAGTPGTVATRSNPSSRMSENQSQARTSWRLRATASGVAWGA